MRTLFFAVSYTMYLGVNVKCCYFCPILPKFEICGQISMKVLNIKFHGNPSSRIRADTCGQTDMTNLTLKLPN